MACAITEATRARPLTTLRSLAGTALTKGSAQERLAGRRSSTPTRISEPRNTVTDGTTIAGTGVERLLTVPEAAHFLRVSTSWLDKARMRGDGPPYVKIGRSVRYAESGLVQWMKSRQRLSTSEGSK